MIINSINSLKGKLNDLQQIETLDKEKMLFFKKNGIHNFRKNHSDEFEMMISCANKTLKDINRKEIKKVIFSTSSFDNYTRRKFLFSKLLLDLGLPHAMPVGVFMSRCNNYGAAFKIAKSILYAENHSKVLLINFDWMEYSSTPQVMNSNLSVLSDAVVCCILHNENVEGYKLIDLELQTNQLLHQKNLGLINEMKFLSSGLNNICKTILERNNLTNADFKVFITGNYNQIVQKNYAMMSGFDPQQISYDHSQGHFFSGDQLIHLEKITKESKLASKDKLFLLGTGDYFWSASIFELNK